MSRSVGSPGHRAVVVVGAINVDFVVAAERLPGPGDTVVGAGLEQHGGGKGANAAVAAARAGAPVHLIGAVGSDETAPIALADLREADVELAGVAELEREATGAALIVVDRHGENQIAVGAGANAALSAAWVQDQLAKSLPGAGCVLVSTEIPGPSVAAAVRAATAAGVTCVLNSAPPIPAVVELLELAPVLTPNARELAELCAMLDPDEARAAADEPTEARAADDPNAARATADGRALALAARTRAPVVVTLGADGALVATPAGELLRIAPPAAEVVDTTGAGDTFNGVFAARLAAGDELADAVHVAIVAATLSVSHRGARTGMPRAAAIDDALKARTG